MMRSLYSAVTGLKNHQTKMDVIGNNIANVNTVGYKTSRVVFQDIFSQTLQSATAPQANNGGTNPRQIGLGVTLSSIDVLHGSAPSQYTGRELDLALEGDGFFVIRTGAGDRDLVYSRAGNFSLGPTGYLVTSGGQYVQCFGSTYQSGNEGVTEEKGWAEMTVVGFENLTYSTVRNAQEVQVQQSGTYTFSIAADGTLTVLRGDRPLDPQPTIELWDETNNALVDFSTPPATLEAGNTYSISIEGIGEFGFDIAGTVDKDYASLEELVAEIAPQFGKIAINVKNNDTFIPNNTMGDMYINEQLYYDVAIDEGGAIKAIMKTDAMIPGTGYYALKGEIVTLGYVAIGTFLNNPGLEKIGSNQYRESANSGRVQFTTAGADGVARIKPGALEMSNVDLANEFTEMITTQRGFQANSRTITTTDSMLEEIVNLKR